MSLYINVIEENLEEEHLCCAIGDKKHATGVIAKKEWLKMRLKEGHVFRKLDARGKVFIEYAPLTYAWVPVTGENYMFIYCFWVAGSYKEKGHGKALLEYCIADAKAQGKSGVCVISSAKKKPFLSDKKYLARYGFETVDEVGDGYELLALSFDGSVPKFADSVRFGEIKNKELTIYYSPQCPYIPNCIKEVESYANENRIPLSLIPVDTLEKAKAVPALFNNWAVFYEGKFKTVHLLNANQLKKLLATQEQY